MIDLDYQTSLYVKISRLLPKYRFNGRLAAMLANIDEIEAKHLYKLIINQRKDELNEFIETHI